MLEIDGKRIVSEMDSHKIKDPYDILEKIVPTNSKDVEILRSWVDYYIQKDVPYAIMVEDNILSLWIQRTVPVVLGTCEKSPFKKEK